MYAFYQIEDICNLLTLCIVVSGYHILPNAFSVSIEMIIFFFLFFHLSVVDYIDF